MLRALHNRVEFYVIMPWVRLLRSRRQPHRNYRQSSTAAYGGLALRIQVLQRNQFFYALFGIVQAYTDYYNYGARKLTG